MTKTTIKRDTYQTFLNLAIAEFRALVPLSYVPYDAERRIKWVEECSKNIAILHASN